MRWALCQLDEIHVAGTTGGGRLTRGARVDLDALVSPGLTYAQALGDFVQSFTLEVPPKGKLKGLPVDEDAPTPEKKDT